MITAANEEGQSVLEFLFMLPVMMGLVMLMVRVNTAIQISIVDQQYAREQAHLLTFNSPIFPQIQLRYAQLVGKNYNQMLMGVGDNIVPVDNSPYNPEASVQNIARNRRVASLADDTPQKEPDPDQGGLRARVRVRNSVSLCSQINVIRIGGQYQPILAMNNLGDGQIPQGASFNLPEGPIQFEYCRSDVIHE